MVRVADVRMGPRYKPNASARTLPRAFTTLNANLASAVYSRHEPVHIPRSLHTGWRRQSGRTTGFHSRLTPTSARVDAGSCQLSFTRLARANGCHYARRVARERHPPCRPSRPSSVNHFGDVKRVSTVQGGVQTAAAPCPPSPSPHRRITLAPAEMKSALRNATVRGQCRQSM